eukprot:29380-Pelagococcus_subviridis.AAC.19
MCRIHPTPTTLPIAVETRCQFLQCDAELLLEREQRRLGPSFAAQRELDRFARPSRRARVELARRVLAHQSDEARSIAGVLQLRAFWRLLQDVGDVKPAGISHSGGANRPEFSQRFDFSPQRLLGQLLLLFLLFIILAAVAVHVAPVVIVVSSVARAPVHVLLDVAGRGTPRAAAAAAAVDGAPRVQRFRERRIEIRRVPRDPQVDPDA